MDIIKDIMEELKINNVFLTGAGGTGKSFFTKKIIQRYEGLDKEIVILGSTGIAASNIGGQTIHSFFKIGLCSNIEQYNKFIETTKPQIRLGIKRKLEEIIPCIDLLIIDEISMVSADLLDLLEYLLDCYGFQGKILVVGDFYQLPPVETKEKGKYAFEAESWEYRLKFKKFELKTIYRTKDVEFIEVLNNIRIGEIVPGDIKYLEGLRLNKDKVKSQSPTILAATNKEALCYNKTKLQEIKAPLHTYDWNLSLNVGGPSEEEKELWKKYNGKKIFNFCNSLLAEEKLNIKVGSSIIFISNGDRYYNGEKGRIIEIKEELKFRDQTEQDYKLGKEYVEEVIVVEKQNGELVDLYKTKWELVEYEGRSPEIKKNVIATIFQYPIKLAYAMTIHKAQGLSIDNVICDINKIFTYSQFYVCISRAINPKNTYIHYSSNDFNNHIRKICNVDNRVVEFYKNG